MKNISIISLLFIGMLYACTNDLDYIESPELTARALVDDNSASSTNPTLLTNWENVSTIILSNPLGGGVSQQITAPWSNGTKSQLSTEFRTDILKENGWKMLFIPLRKKG